MGSIKSKSKIKEATLTAVVTRKDGSVQNLGVVSFYHKSLFVRAAFWCRQVLAKVKEKISWRRS